MVNAVIHTTVQMNTNGIINVECLKQTKEMHKLKVWKIIILMPHFIFGLNFVKIFYYDLVDVNPWQNWYDMILFDLFYGLKASEPIEYNAGIPLLIWVIFLIGFYGYYKEMYGILKRVLNKEVE